MVSMKKSIQIIHSKKKNIPNDLCGLTFSSDLCIESKINIGNALHFMSEIKPLDF